MQKINDTALKASEENLCFLYRYFDRFNTLLYIGISNNSLTRFKQHIKSSIWIEFASYSHIETYKTREEALKAEKEAILNENPLFNVNHRIEDRKSLSKEDLQRIESNIQAGIDFYMSQYYKDSSLMVFTTLGIKVKQLTKLSAFKILYALQTLLAAIPKEVYSKPNTIYISQKTLAERLDMHRVTVSAGLEELEKISIIFLDKKYSIILNPAYFWRGNLVEHQDMVEKYFQEGLLDKEELIQALEEVRCSYTTYFI